MTGGQYLRFNSGKQLDSEMGMLANQVHNRYILSFQPSDRAAGPACAERESKAAAGRAGAGTNKLLGELSDGSGRGYALDLDRAEIVLVLFPNSNISGMRVSRADADC